MRALVVRLLPSSFVLAASGVIALGLSMTSAAASDDIEGVLKEYLRAVYSRDAASAYALLSAADRDIKTLDEYAQEIGAFDGPALRVAKALADEIDFDDIDVQLAGDIVDITFDVTLPNANDPALRELLHGFAADRLNELTLGELDALTGEIRTMASDDRLPTLDADGERWSLVRDDDQWRVFENWAEAVEVRFDAVTFHDLPWEFEPLRTRVMALHGETIHMAYRAKNNGDEEITAKARHIVGPGDDAAYIDIISCFCFLEETLAPGEEAELSLVFRVDYEAPEDIKAFTVKYEFYPAERFPEDDQAHSQVRG